MTAAAAEVGPSTQKPKPIVGSPGCQSQTGETNLGYTASQLVDHTSEASGGPGCGHTYPCPPEDVDGRQRRIQIRVVAVRHICRRPGTDGALTDVRAASALTVRWRASGR